MKKDFMFFMTAVAAAAGAGGAPIVIDPADDFFFDDFNGTNASLTGRAGWAAIGDAGKAAKIIADGGIAKMLDASAGGDNPRGWQLAGSLSTDHYVEFEYDFGAGGVYTLVDQWYMLAYQDLSNCIFCQFEIGSPGPLRMKVISGVADSWSEICVYDEMPNAGVVRVSFVGAAMRVTVNGVINQSISNYTSYPGVTLSGGTTKTGPAGFRQTWQEVAFAKYLKTNPLDIVITDPAAGYGRDPSGNRAISFAGTYIGTPVSWAYRRRDGITGDTTSDWTALSVTAGSGAWSSVPITFATGVHSIDVAWIGGDGKAHVATSTPFAVAMHISFWGQSNAGVSSQSGGAWVSAGDYNVLGFGGDGSMPSRIWSDAESGSQSYMPNASSLAKVLADELGIPVMVSGIGAAGRSLSDLLPGSYGDEWDTYLVPHIEEVGGNVEHWIFDQGEAEAWTPASSATYATDFPVMCSALRSIGGHPNACVFLRLIGDDSEGTNSPSRTAQAAAFRALQESLESYANKVWVAAHTLGTSLQEDGHLTHPSSVELCRREGLTIARRAYGALAYDGRGPVVTGATRSGAVITLAVDLNGATGISGSALTGYTVSADNFTTALTISSVNVSGSTIVITLAADPGGPVKVGSYREANYDDSSLATGSYADGTTIPVMPISTPVTTTS